MTDAVRTEIIPAEPQVVAIADPMVSMIERVVMDPNASLDKLERMLAMKERLDATNARRAFDAAISEAKAEIPPIIKNRTVDFTGKTGIRTHYKHEDMAEIARTVDPILGRHGLSYRYRTLQEAGRVTVTCVMSHRDGHSEETTLSGAPDDSGNKNSLQQVGSTITFLQRYTLKAALGLAASHDDDARAATPDAGSISADQFLALRDLLDKSGSDEGRFLKFFKVETLDEFPVARFGEADKMLRAKIAEKANG